jgi:hypothetical protein
MHIIYLIKNKLYLIKKKIKLTKKKLIMKKIKLKRLAFIIAILSIIFTCGCRGLIPISCTVVMTNKSTKEVHMWISGEGIGPTNKLAPGKSRKKTYYYSEEAMKEVVFNEQMCDVNVMAGTNGKTEFNQLFTTQDGATINVNFTGFALVLVK